MDIEIVIRKTAIYSILTLLLTGILLSFVILGEMFFRGIIGYNSVWPAILAVFIIAGIFQPLKNRIQTVIDRLFFKGKYDYRTTLRNLSQKLGTIIELDQLLGYVSQNITDTLKVDQASVYLLEKEKDCYVIKSPH